VKKLVPVGLLAQVAVDLQAVAQQAEAPRLMRPGAVLVQVER